MGNEMNEKLQNAFKTFAKEKGLCTMKELQEKLDWLETNGYFKFENEYRFQINGGHVIAEETVLNAPLGFLKAGHEQWLEREMKRISKGPEKEVEVDIKEVFKGTDPGGKKSIYVMAEVIVKFDGVQFSRIRGEYKFDATIHGDYAYYHEMIKGAFQ